MTLTPATHPRAPRPRATDRPTPSADGPFATEAEARLSPFARRARLDSDIYDNPRVALDLRHDHFLRILEAADVTLGAFDARIVAWFARTWEHTTVAVFAGLITRAYLAGRTSGATEARSQ